MIFSHVSNILNSRPLSSQSDDQLVLNANQLVKPYLSNEDQEIMVSKFLEEIFNDEDKHLLLKKIFENNHQMAATASQVLKREFLSNSKLFSNKPAGLKPVVGDVVAVLKEEPRLGLIVEVVSAHRVVVRHKHRGSNVEQTYHSKILALVFRPVSAAFFVSIFKQPSLVMNHLLERFWTKLKAKIS